MSSSKLTGAIRLPQALLDRLLELVAGLTAARELREDRVDRLLLVALRLERGLAVDERAGGHELRGAGGGLVVAAAAGGGEGGSGQDGEGEKELRISSRWSGRG